MRSYTLLLVAFSLSLFITSCTYDVGIDAIDKYNVDIGSFTLLSESLEMLPYLDKIGVVFMDSLANELVLTIQESQVILTNGTLFHYDVYEPGDTVRYGYRSQYKSFHLRNDSLDLSFTISLAARPYYSDPTSSYVADVTSILRNVSGVPYSLVQVFYHVLNQRTWPEVFLSAENIGFLAIFNKNFDDVLLTEYFGSKPMVYFNYDVGIVSFTDHTDKQWRFDRFQ